MIEINEKNNYLEIIDSRDLSNLKTTFDPKKDTTINVFYLPEEEHTEEDTAPIEGGGDAGGDEPIILTPDPVQIGGGNPIILAPDLVEIGNIEIKRTGGTTVIDKNSFVNLQVFIDGIVSNFSECLDYLTAKTAI